MANRYVKKWQTWSPAPEGNNPMQQYRLVANWIEIHLAKKGLRGAHGKHVEYGSAAWPCNMEGQLHAGLY